MTPEERARQIAHSDCFDVDASIDNGGLGTTCYLVRFDKLQAAIAAAIREAVAEKEAENKRLRDGLIDMLDLAEMLAGNDGWDTYKARFNFARAALRGET